MSWPERKCEGCTAILPAQTAGRRRRWCTDRCRKLATYGQACMDCGRITTGDDSLVDEPRCIRCTLAHAVATGSRADMVRHREREERIQSAWAAGESMQRIADELGTTVNSLGTDMVRMRAKGIDLPYRRPAGPTEHRVSACQ